MSIELDIPLGQRVSDELLPHVRQPAQYIGGEINQLVRPGDWDAADVRIAVAFPDTYTVGMSHLGCQIIYWLANHRDGVCAERVYVPWIDAEQRMRDRNIPLFTWDTRQPVNSCDILAVSLQYEMGFTNLLTLLDLSGIPLRSAERTDEHPLVIVDLVVHGDGEHAMNGIIDAYRELADDGVARRDMILHLARRFEWIYAPSLYDVRYHADNTLAEVTPRVTGLPERIVRCQTPDFEHAPFPRRPLVPYVETIHDRISIEIMRGCPQLCRFCHAGYTKRPLRLRSVDAILEIAEEAYRSTGQEELGLLSLSTADYPHLRELSERVNAHFADRNVNISVPSLRVDKMLANIPWMVNAVRKSGLTIAVEAARDDMRAAIRKKTTDGRLLDGVRAAYEAGWRSVKLYFMAGFPGERPEDITGIVDLSRQISEARRPIAGGPARVKASVSWLVPKPFTPFQWAAQPEADYFREARRMLNAANRSRKSAVKIITHGPERSVLEAVFARGDRRLADVIETAWRRGARFDGWDETFDNNHWTDAFSHTGIDPAFYAHRERPLDELMPWEMFRSGPPLDWMKKQYDDVFTKINVPKPLQPVNA
jgi:radical SAM family uncharacterized protein